MKRMLVHIFSKCLEQLWGGGGHDKGQKLFKLNVKISSGLNSIPTATVFANISSSQEAVSWQPDPETVCMLTVRVQSIPVELRGGCWGMCSISSPRLRTQATGLVTSCLEEDALVNLESKRLVCENTVIQSCIPRNWLIDQPSHSGEITNNFK